VKISQEFLQKIKKRTFKALRNKYIVSTLIITLFIVFIDNYNLFTILEYHARIKDLEKSKEYYQDKAKIDRYELEELESNSNLERLAREKYLMKKENEDVFIIIEED